MNNLPNQELLSYAIEHDIIDIAYIQDRIIMDKQKEYLSKHPFSVWEGKDKKWRTYLPDDAKGRRLIKRKTKESIEESIISFIRKWKKMRGLILRRCILDGARFKIN